jgi:O-methyltransferase involved in polyketide biosynthesis
VELASGLSPRGIVWAEENPKYTFIEVDLPDEVDLKWKIIEKLIKAKAINAPHHNFGTIKGSVTEEKVFKKLTFSFNSGEPVGVICEGLLRYLSFADKATLASHIHKLLQKFGGMWVTPDIEILTDSEQIRLRRQSVGMRGVNVEENIFTDIPSAKKFFEDLGFAVAMDPLVQITPELASIDRCGLTLQETEAILKNRVSFIMTVA